MSRGCFLLRLFLTAFQWIKWSSSPSTSPQPAAATPPASGSSCSFSFCRSPSAASDIAVWSFRAILSASLFTVASLLIRANYLLLASLAAAPNASVRRCSNSASWRHLSSGARILVVTFHVVIASCAASTSPPARGSQCWFICASIGWGSITSWGSGSLVTRCAFLLGGVSTHSAWLTCPIRWRWIGGCRLGRWWGLVRACISERWVTCSRWSFLTTGTWRWRRTFPRLVSAASLVRSHYWHTSRPHPPAESWYW